jgi:tRNA U55 pseudouridine synthase TruB
VKELVRLNYGPFNIEGAVSIRQLEDAIDADDWQKLLYPIDFILNEWSAVIVAGEQERIVKNGGGIVIEDSQVKPDGDKRCRAYSQDGSLLALLCFNPERGKWQPGKVFV